MVRYQLQSILNEILHFCLGDDFFFFFLIATHTHNTYILKEKKNVSLKKMYLTRNKS